MILRNYEMLRNYAKDCYLHTQLHISEDDFVTVFCDGYLQALGSVVSRDLMNAQNLIDTARTRSLPGSELEKNFNEWEALCNYCGNPRKEHLPDCPTLTTDL